VKRKFLTLGLSVLLALVGVEGALRYFTRLPITPRSNKRPHPRYLYTLDPALEDVDDSGFRNPRVYDGEPIIAIGDSHTYGVGVVPSQSWPRKLARMLRRSVYNMGVPSYHFYTYVALIEDMLAHRPEAVLLGVHPGTDFSLLICPALRLPYWQRRVHRDGGLTRTSCEGRNVRPDSSPLLFGHRPAHSATGDLLYYTVVKPFLRPLRKRLRQSLDRWWYAPPQRISFRLRAGEGTMILRKVMFARRVAAVDLSRPTVSTSLDNAGTLLATIARETRRRGVFLGVLLLPSQERVIYEWARRRGTSLPEVAVRAGYLERRLTRRFRRHLDRARVPHRDLTDAMVAAFDRSLRRGHPLYSPPDDHPDERGYRVYARGAHRLLQGSRPRGVRSRGNS